MTIIKKGEPMDLIDRQAAIDAIEAEKINHGDYLTSSYVGYEMAEKVVEQLPPIQPAEPKKGRWIGKYPVTSVCSECGFLIHDSKVKAFAYCPNCGADMRGEQDG